MSVNKNKKTTKVEPENKKDVLDIIDVQNKIIKKILKNNNILIENDNNITDENENENENEQTENYENEPII